MLSTLWTGQSGMNANQNKLDAISNNISNSGTNGYKRVEVGFQDLMQYTLDRNGVPVNDKTSSTGTGVKTTSWKKDFSQGFLQETMRATDITIDGAGFFRLTMPDGSDVYTRDGAFGVDSMGRIVDGRGNKVYLEYMPGYSEANVNFTSKNLLIDTYGSVFVKDGDKFNKVAELPIYTAMGDASFAPVGDNLFLPVNGVQVFRTRDADIYQGYLEGANVDIAEEFSDMIMTQRAFQLSSKGITTADEMWGMVNQLSSR
ncbi:MAG: flagellar hook-basal body complex protein [Clostridium sp.]